MLATQAAACTRHNGNTPFEINAHKAILENEYNQHTNSAAMPRCHSLATVIHPPQRLADLRQDRDTRHGIEL
jgi:hypothetical protein